MERKLRNRVSTLDIQIILMKLLPWIFFLLLLVASSSLGIATGDPKRPAVD